MRKRELACVVGVITLALFGCISLSTWAHNLRATQLDIQQTLHANLQAAEHQQNAGAEVRAELDNLRATQLDIQTSLHANLQAAEHQQNASVEVRAELDNLRATQLDIQTSLYAHLQAAEHQHNAGAEVRAELDNLRATQLDIQTSVLDNSQSNSQSAGFSARRAQCEPDYLLEPNAVVMGREHDTFIELLIDTFYPPIGGTCYHRC